MSKIKIGCQGYTWEMVWDEWGGSVEDVFAATAEAGYASIEVSAWMLEPYFDRPQALLAELDKHRLAMPVTTLVGILTEPKQAEETIRETEKLMAFMRSVNCPQLVFAGGNFLEDIDIPRDVQFKTMCETYNRIAHIGAELGILVGCHPHSHHGTIVDSPEDYDRLMELTDPAAFHFGPDTAHMQRSGLDVPASFRKYFPRITHVHFKDCDADGNYVMMGEGVCDFPAILRLLEELGYEGWVMAEEESEAAGKDPAGAVKKNRQYLKTLGY